MQRDIRMIKAPMARFVPYMIRPKSLQMASYRFCHLHPEALQSAGINTLKALSAYSEKEILKLHRMGPKTIPILKQSLKNEGLIFKHG